MSLDTSAVQPVIFQPAHPANGTEFTLEDLHKHLQTAIYVEMSTIPLYLYAYYSIKSDGTKPAKQARRLISEVFQEEMLHLALASNILYSLGKPPTLYSPASVPVFPTKILYTSIEMKLRDGRQENIQTFVDIEAPVKPVPTDDSEDVLPDYKSIGEFYEVIKKELEKHQSSIHEGTNQINPDDGIWYNEGLVVVSNLEQANIALDTIVTQGEGADAGSHHSKFLKLRTLPEEWQYYPVVENPQTETTYKDKVFYEVSRTFDASYCYLLLNIERLYQVSGGTRSICTENIMGIMQEILSDLAKFLINEQYDENHVAAPCFNYYSLDTQDPLSSLKKEIAAAIPKYDGPKQKELKRIESSINKLKQLPAANV